MIRRSFFKKTASLLGGALGFLFPTIRRDNIVAATTPDTALLPSGTSELSNTKSTVDRPSVRAFGDGPETLRNAARDADASQSRYIYIPNRDFSYSVSEPIGIQQPGIRIWGDQGSTYNRGSGKGGWIQANPGLERIFDLGMSRERGNPADNWQIDGISLRQAPSSADRSTDGIAFTTRTNGPDRGATIRSVSFVGLRDAITIENPDISVSLASLNVESCVFWGNTSAINAKGRLFGLRFVANQCEQNKGTEGIIRGSIDAAVTIDDNMLEGQANTISIDIPKKFGNFPQLTSKGNYFEANSGDFVYRFRTTNPAAHISIGPNYTHRITAQSYLLIERSAGAIFVDLYDDYPLTLKTSPTTLKFGSNIFRKRQRIYNIIDPSPIKPAEIVIADYGCLTDVLGDHIHATPGSTANLFFTPHGYLPCIRENEFISIPNLTINTGDLLSLNILCAAQTQNTGKLGAQLVGIDNNNVLYQWQDSLIGYELAGKWALVNVAINMRQRSKGIKFRFLSNDGKSFALIAGVAAKCLGYASQQLNAVAPVTPNIHKTSLLQRDDFPAINLAPGSASPEYRTKLTGAVFGSFVDSTLNIDSQGVIINARVAENDIIKWYILNPENNPNGRVSLTKGTIFFRLLS